ncbi:transposase [Bradyrhizobium jicamae]|uniref:Transposase n=1 Tax=Bradyrhizobium jicamae TaxID=280332 RepID=A0ABS5FYB1_9BRAD|nr:transposase [Bradyrhizobium jicamae]MBR0801809.1 transposase [Bradyrhizobium jicamae]
MKFIRIGVDLAKNYFQIHALSNEAAPAVKRKLTRRTMREFFSKIEPCRVGMEACGSAHYWARELKAMGHDVSLMPPAYTKPYGAPRRRVLPVEEGSTQRIVD